MVRITLLLLSLTLWSNSYAWYCTYTPTSEGYIAEDSLYCEGIDPAVALESHWCVSYQPDDPICDPYKQTICVDTVEYRTQGCPEYYEGSISQSRNYSCSSQTWSDWFDSGGACIPLPPSCLSSTVTQTRSCDQGYNGEIKETGEYICQTPYSEPIFTGWVEESNTCIQSVIDINDPTSVVSPISINATTTNIDSATAPQVANTMTTNPIQSAVNEQLSEPVEQPISDTNEDVSNETDSKEEVKTTKENRNNKKSKEDKDDVENDTHEILPGFGVVLSPLTLSQNPFGFAQLPIPQPFSLEQEFTDEFKRLETNIIDFIKQGDSEDYYSRHSDSAWDRILSNQFLY